MCGILLVFKRRKEFKEPNTILVIQLWGVGETILTLPAIKALKNKFGKAKITVLTTKGVKDVFYNNKDVEHVEVLGLTPFSILKFINKNCKKYDLVVDFEEYLNTSSIISFFTGKYSVGFGHKVRSGLYSKKIAYNDRQHAVATFGDLAGLVGAGFHAKELVKLNYSKDDKKFVDNLFKQHGITKKDFVVGIGAGTAESAKSRAWPKERFAELGDKLAEKYNAKIIFVGNKNEVKLINKIKDLMKNKAVNFAGETSLRQLVCLIERCNLFVSNDAGPMHIAAAQRVKTIGLFGPNLPERFGPYGSGNIGIYRGAECSPCVNVHKGQIPECKWKGEDYQKCMKQISAGDVLKEVEKIIK